MRVLLMGRLGDVAGETECSLRVDEPITVRELFLVVGQLYPNLGAYVGVGMRRESVTVSVNGRQLLAGDTLHDGDEVLLVAAGTEGDMDTSELP